MSGSFSACDACGFCEARVIWEHGCPRCGETKRIMLEQDTTGDTEWTNDDGGTDETSDNEGT